MPEGGRHITKFHDVQPPANLEPRDELLVRAEALGKRLLAQHYLFPSRDSAAR